MRVVLVAFFICALAFAAGIAGDLSLAAQPSRGESVRIHIPADAVRAHPLPMSAAMSSTARSLHRHGAHAHYLRVRAHAKPHRHLAAHGPKIDPVVAAKRANISEALT